MAPGTVSMKIAPNAGVNIGCLLTPPDSAEIALDKSSSPPTFTSDGHDVPREQQRPEVQPEVPVVCRKIGGPAVDAGTQTDCDPVVMEARLIFLDIWNLVKQRTPYHQQQQLQQTPMRSSASSVMYRVAGQLLDKHAIIYASVIAKLNLVDDDERIDYFAFRVVCDEVLDDGRGRRPEYRHQQPDVSWGRIVALYALFIHVARDCHRRGLDRAALGVADFVGVYVGERVSSWITKQGGWSVMERTFPAEDHVEQTVWKGLLVTGIGLGMLATAIKAIR